ncbi:hypothetical protein [Kingella potus]|uniref:hypothetical protein n=1 Tax=Kingella potus TaxID=265175 RepID=UPI001FD0B184|nr:hypothetical protein [Kingella potus]UOP00404.1 hypothetical protein LVJ84_11060 [Kingella potus]
MSSKATHAFFKYKYGRNTNTAGRLKTRRKIFRRPLPCRTPPQHFLPPRRVCRPKATHAFFKYKYGRNTNTAGRLKDRVRGLRHTPYTNSPQDVPHSGARVL